AAVLIFNKGKASNNVLFIDASKGFDSGKNQNKLRKKDIAQIVEAYQDFTQGKLKPGVITDKFSFVATKEELVENEYNLNIPRYVDTFEEEAEVDIPAVQKEIEGLERELKEVQERMEK